MLSYVAVKEYKVLQTQYNKDPKCTVIMHFLNVLIYKSRYYLLSSPSNLLAVETNVLHETPRLIVEVAMV